MSNLFLICNGIVTVSFIQSSTKILLCPFLILKHVFYHILPWPHIWCVFTNGVPSIVCLPCRGFDFSLGIRAYDRMTCCSGEYLSKLEIKHF